MTKLKERQIPLFYKPPQVSVAEIDRIVTFYNSDIPIGDMIRRIQFARDARDGKSISYPDIYTILFHALENGRVKQRRNPIGELPIQEFLPYFKAFRGGGASLDCWDAISLAAKTCTSKSFHEKLFRCLSDRWREHRRKHVDEIVQIDGQEKERLFMRQLIKHFKRLKIGAPLTADQKAQGEIPTTRQAIILYLDDLPLHFLAEIKLLPKDAARELLLVLNPAMLADLESIPQPAAQVEPARPEFRPQPHLQPKSATKFAQQTRQINEAVEAFGIDVLTNEELKSMGQLPRDPLGPSQEELQDDAEIARLTAAVSPRPEPAQRPTTPVAFPQNRQVTKPSIQPSQPEPSGNPMEELLPAARLETDLTLENLGDDDDAAPLED